MTTLVASYTPGSNRNNFTGYLGLKFTVSGTNITASTLGLRVATNNVANQSIYLLNNSNATLASAVINITGVAVGTFVYASITPQTLTVGSTYYVLVQETNGGQQWSDLGSVTLNGATGAIGAVVVSLGTTPSTFNSGQMYVGVDINGTPPTPQQNLPYWNLRTQQNISAWQDEYVDDDITAKSLASWRKPRVMSWIRPTESVSKIIQYTVMAPRDNSESVSKIVQYAVLGLAGEAISKAIQYTVLSIPSESVSKVVQYVVVETNKSLQQPRFYSIVFQNNHWADADDLEYAAQFKRIHDARRLGISGRHSNPVFIMT